jgi:hypothetical protein
MTHYLIYGLMRAGNHAIIEWLAAHYDHALHHNDITRRGANNYHEYGNLELVPDCTLYSVETEEPFQLLGIATNVIPSPSARKIAILRDYYNMQASLIRLGRTRTWARGIYRTYKTLWPQFAKAYIAGPQDFVVYNRWVQDDGYLKELEGRYGLRAIPRQSNLPLSGIGWGSSFDKTCQWNERWREMNTLDWVWRDALDCPEARELNEQIFGWSLQD